MRRLYKYLPPGQLRTAELLIRQNNERVRSALQKQEEHLHELSRVSTMNENPTAWMRFYKPHTGQEWYLLMLTDKDVFCLYYNGSFRERVYSLDLLRMISGIVLDIHWVPQTIEWIQNNHQDCDVVGRKLSYKSIMLKEHK